MRHLSCFVWATVAALVGGGCSIEYPSACEDRVTNGVTAQVVEGPMESIVTGALKVRGVTTSDVFLEAVRVAGELVENKSGNFAQWEVTLSPQVLTANRSGNRARIRVSAVDTCGTHHPNLYEFTVPIALPNIPVEDLVLEDPTLPAGACALPMRTGTAQWTARASKSSAGAEVQFDVAPTTDVTRVPPNGRVRLREDGAGASASVVFSAARAGSYLVSVSGEGAATAPKPILVVDAPTFSPASLSVRRGTSARVFVMSAADLDTCQARATHPEVTTVRTASGAADLLSGPAAVTVSPSACDQVEVVGIDVTFASLAPPDAEVFVTCTDRFGQSAGATYKAADALPAPRLERLSLRASLPNGQCYLPSTMGAFAELVATGNVEATGQVVTLTAAGGTFVAGSNSTATRTLVADGSDAIARAFFFSAQAAADLPIVAQAESLGAGPVRIRVAGPPTMHPSGRSIARSSPIRIQVETLGTLQRCSAVASHPSHTRVTLDVPGQPELITTTASVSLTPNDCTDVESVAIELEFDAEAPAGASASIRCQDVYQQAVEGSFTAP